MLTTKRLSAACAFLIAAACGPRGGSDDDQTHAPGEELSGGVGTVDDAGATAFSHPLPTLDLAGERAFFKGRALFRDAWITAPSSAASRDGLGPLFNARTCEACHAADGRGRPPESPDLPMLTMLVRLSVADASGAHVPEPTYGDQIQPFAIDGVAAEGSVHIAYETVTGAYADGEPYELLRPVYDLSRLARGPVAPGTAISPRVAPVMIGLGLLEAVPEATIRALADPDDADGDGISGRPNTVQDRTTGQPVLGRFGWKAGQPTLRQQSAGAFAGDIGITSSLFPEQPCGSTQGDCRAAASGGEPELEEVILDSVAFYSGTLAVPARRRPGDATVARGRQIFNDQGCAACHTPQLAVGPHATLPVTEGDLIRPYTDLLLHDMGEGLADGRPDGLASGSEWRTPPLWGIGLLPAVNGHLRLLHDGRARGFAEAVLWHGGEAAAAAERFRTAPAADRQALVAFLESL